MTYQFLPNAVPTADARGQFAQLPLSGVAAGAAVEVGGGCA